MHKILSILRTAFFHFGEHIAFIFVAAFAFALLFIGETQPAFSEKGEVKKVLPPSFETPVAEVDAMAVVDESIFEEPEVPFSFLEDSPRPEADQPLAKTLTPTNSPAGQSPLGGAKPTATSSPTQALTATPTPSPSPIPTATPRPKADQPLAETPEPTAVPTATPTPEQQVLAATVDPNSEEIWEKIADCESNKNWSIVDSTNTYFGGLQFSQGAWESVGGSGSPASASREEQIMRGKLLQQKRGWGVWGMCAKRLGLN